MKSEFLKFGRISRFFVYRIYKFIDHLLSVCAMGVESLGEELLGAWEGCWMWVNLKWEFLDVRENSLIFLGYANILIINCANDRLWCARGLWNPHVAYMLR